MIGVGVDPLNNIETYELKNLLAHRALPDPLVTIHL